MLALVLAVTVAVGACTTSSSEDDDASTSTTVPEARATLRVASVPWPVCFDPVRCDDEAASMLVHELTQPRLFEVDAGGLHVATPVLASTPVSSVDEVTGRQVITYRLAVDARWHDGRQITSSDLHATWRVMQQQGIGAHDPHRFVVDVDDRDPKTAIVTLSAPTADWRELFGGFEHWLAQADDVVDPTPPEPGATAVGAGPFEVVSATDELIVLAARDEHWDVAQRASIDQVRIERLPEAVADWPDLTDFHAVIGLVPDDALPDGLMRRQAPGDRVVGAFLDRRSPALQQRAVREAVAAVIDRDQLAEVVGAPTPLPWTCMGWLPGDPSCGTATVPPTSAARADAVSILETAGWTAPPGVTRTRAGVPLVLPFSIDPTIEGAGPLAVALRIRLRTLGADVPDALADGASWRDPTRTVSAGVAIEEVPIGTVGRLSAVLACHGLTGPLAWCGPDLDAAFAALDGATQRIARVEAGEVLAQLAATESSFVPLFQTSSPWALASDRLTTGRSRPGRGPLAALWEWTVVDP